MFLVSIIDINKALSKKSKIDLYIKLLKYFYKFLDIFSYIDTNKLLLFYNREIDYRIDLEKEDRKVPKVLWGPLYNISHDELLVL